MPKVSISSYRYSCIATFDFCGSFNLYPYRLASLVSRHHVWNALPACQSRSVCSSSKAVDGRPPPTPATPLPPASDRKNALLPLLEKLESTKARSPTNKLTYTLPLPIFLFSWLPTLLALVILFCIACILGFLVHCCLRRWRAHESVCLELVL